MDKRKVLIVDDNPMNLRLGEAIFESVGYEVLVAPDGIVALEILMQNKIALVITDILMPNMDGYTLCHKIRTVENIKNIPIIVYTATYTSQSDEKVALQAGANIFIRKPATLSQLLNAANELLSNPGKFQIEMATDVELTDIMRQYNSGLIEKLEQKNEELVAAQTALKKGYQDIQTLLDNTDEIFLTLDTNLNIITFNKNAKIAGRKYLKMDVVEGVSVLKYSAPERIDYIKSIYADVLAGNARQTENTFVLDNGEIAYFRTLMKPIFNEAREIIGVFVIERDITDITVKQKQIDFDRSNLDALINSTADMMWSVDTDCRLITYNKAFANAISKMSGKNIEIGDNVLRVNVAEYRIHRWEANYKRAFTGETFSIVEYSENPDPYWSEISFYPIRRDDKVIGTACYSHNITSSKRDEEKINNLNRLYTFVSAVNQTIVHVTNDRHLFDSACTIAVNIGKFELAWIGILQDADNKIVPVAHCNATQYDLDFIEHHANRDESLTKKVLFSNEFSLVNNFENLPNDNTIRYYAQEKKFKSAIALPIRKYGVPIATYNLYSTRADLFDQEEIHLLCEIAGDISFALDVLEKERLRQKMEGSLLQSEMRLNQAQAIAHFGSWSYNIGTDVAEWSEEACRIYGLDINDNIQNHKAWISFVHPEDMNDVMEAVMQSFEKFTNLAIHHRIIRTDGEVRYIYSQTQFEFDIEGNPITLYGVIRDETQTKETEAALKRSEENLRLIMDLMPQGIFVKNGEGKFLYANKPFARLHGLPPDKLINRYLLETIPVQTEAGDFLKDDQEVILTGKMKIVPETNFTDYLGNLHVFRSMKVPFAVPYQNEIAVLGIIDDITKEKHDEYERNKMIADIVQRNRDLEQFSYIVSHNLRNPIAGILGIVELLKMDNLNKEDAAQCMEGLHTSAANLDMVIKDLNFILALKHNDNRQKEQVRFSEVLR